MYGSLDISTSGMIAQRTRLTAISANVANRNSVNTDGTPYRARRVHFAPGDPTATTAEGKQFGVQVSDIEIDQSPFNMRYDPSNPLAQKTGPYKDYVLESNVNIVNEQVNALQAARAYEANVAAAEATKAMYTQALRLLS